MGWSAAFARQACSDFEARDVLLQSGLPECHQLHSLQMAMEKAAKAHYLARGDDAEPLRSSHAYIAKAIPIIVQHGLSHTPGVKPRWLMESVRRLARRIELLAPSVDDGGTAPANCEYPWRDGSGRIVAPVDHDFQIDLRSKAAITMIKEVRARAVHLASPVGPQTDGH